MKEYTIEQCRNELNSCLSSEERFRDLETINKIIMLTDMLQSLMKEKEKCY